MKCLTQNISEMLQSIINVIVYILISNFKKTHDVYTK